MNESSDREKKTSRKRTIRKWIMRIALGLIALAVVAAIVVALIPKPVTVEVASIDTERLVVAVDEDGRTRIKRRYIIAAPLDGSMGRIELHEGDTVEADQVVAEIQPAPSPLVDSRTQAERDASVLAAESSYRQARAARSRVEAELEFAEREAERLRRLAESHSIQESRVDRAELELKTRQEDLSAARYAARVAAHQVEVARAAAGGSDSDSDGDGQNGSLAVRSPVGGVVLSVLRNHQGAVQAGTSLIEVGNPEELELVVDVLTTDAVRISPGQTARIIRWGGDAELTAHVRHIEPRAFSETSALGVEEQRVNVILDIDSPPEMWESLQDEYRVEASITVWESDDALRVPVGSIFRRDGAWQVFTVEGGVAKLQSIEIGQRNGFYAEIIEGLEEGDLVILHPGDEVTDGVEVEPRD